MVNDAEILRVLACTGIQLLTVNPLLASPQKHLLTITHTGDPGKLQFIEHPKPSAAKASGWIKSEASTARRIFPGSDRACQLSECSHWYCF
ncbi:hypothetical protein RBA41_23955 [Massilia sp. CCM 9210]|uniref:hypothetical protein n=1 Tax=Massilia scottii TaxID=3057166 RepID=UPI002796676E|nr:hypothetical protein [Massilia sp. CCM 9210]MDQ1816356.1 hypothetical protein [Massilia sp. CCM 9210]